MNPKIQKLTAEIEKAAARIAELQIRLRELEQQKTDLENTEIVNLFRSVDVAPADLAGFIRAYREQAASPPAYGTGAFLKREADANEE